MNGSELVEMTLNIGGETFKLNTEFNRQNDVREAEFAVRQYFNKLRRNWPDSSDRKILAMTAYQFAFWQKEALKLQKQALDLAQSCADQINEISLNENGSNDDSEENL